MWFFNYLCSTSFISLDCPLGILVRLEGSSAAFLLTYPYPACNSSCFRFWPTREKRASEGSAQNILLFFSAEVQNICKVLLPEKMKAPCQASIQINDS